MAKVNDGGQAFPVPGFPSEWNEPTHGLTKREWFAGKALQGMCNGIQITPSKYEQEVKNLSTWSYFIADAMIAQLNVANLLTWTPTAEATNALPEPLRSFIHELETNCDPAGLVRENMFLKEQNGQLKTVIEDGER